ncbi:MAG TPA: DUF4159 domain-containing protein [Verrucomicrobiae bacterium]|nr:DUF4159 domain-containing protein [Verrucomicrobiae bacterium]
MKRPLFVVIILLLVAGAVWGQRRGGWRMRGGGDERSVAWTEGGITVDTTRVRTAREVASHSTDTPNWTNPPAFTPDAFTFVRIIYKRSFEGDLSGSAGSWTTDFPDSDLNLSFRLQQMTSIKVDPNGRILRLTDPELFNYPWIYMVEPGRLELEEDEVLMLRKYLLNGGFMVADDFWGELQWWNFEQQVKQVFPDRGFVDVPMDHPIFNCVFPIKGPKNALQIPNARTAIRTQYGGPTYEGHDGEACAEVHIRAIYDDKGRIMMLALHNTDNGDGWEREGENDFFFHRFSENIAFPLGINIIFYAMTH